MASVKRSQMIPGTASGFPLGAICGRFFIPSGADHGESCQLSGRDSCRVEDFQDGERGPVKWQIITRCKT